MGLFSRNTDSQQQELTEPPRAAVAREDEGMQRAVAIRKSIDDFMAQVVPLMDECLRSPDHIRQKREPLDLMIRGSRSGCSAWMPYWHNSVLVFAFDTVSKYYSPSGWKVSLKVTRENSGGSARKHSARNRDDRSRSFATPAEMLNFVGDEGGYYLMELVVSA